MQVYEIQSGRGGPDSLILADHPEPMLQAGQVLVKMHAAALNYRDLQVLRGTYGVQPTVPLTLVTVFLFGVAAFGIVPCLQLRVVDKAKGAPNLASAFNIASFNLGNAGGAYLGSLVLSSPVELNAVPWGGGLVAAGGITVAAFSWSLDNRDRSRAQTAVQQKC
jgi:hypothetical protein